MHRMKFASVALLLLPGVALAQDVSEVDGFNVDTFHVSGGLFDHQGTLQLASPHLGLAGSWYAGLGGVYAHDPLVYVKQDEAGNTTTTPLISQQISARLVGGYNIGGAARLDLEVPVYPSVKTTAGTSFAMGDIRVGATLPLLKYQDSGFGIALVPDLVLPTGKPSAYVSSGFGGGIALALGFQAGPFGMAANVGADLAKAAGVGDIQGASRYRLGSSMPYGLGMHVNMGSAFLLGAEGTGSVSLVKDEGGEFQPYNVDPLEAHLYGSYGSGTGLHVTLGGGTGVIAGIGAPDLRLFLGLGWRNPGLPPDADKDGYPDKADSCPIQPEDFDNYEDADGCPDPDNDKDGMVDLNDKCPNSPEDKDGFEDTDGCPDLDNDADGLADTEDRCPNKAGPGTTQGCPDRDGDSLADDDDECPDDSGPLETNGCPDSDSDHVPDIRDACPSDPADSRIDPRRSNGCPSRVVVTKQSIEILEMVYFETNKAIIKPVSFGLLDDVARTLNAYPDIKLVEVSGHTDSVGKDEANLKLSQARAEAVMKYLVNQGVDPSRLIARGYGETKPIDTNDTAEGRAKNRRVAFTILEQ